MLLDTVLSGIPYPIAPTFPACFSICKCQGTSAINSLLGLHISRFSFLSLLFIFPIAR